MKKGWEVKTVGDCCLKTKNHKWTGGSVETYQYIDLSSVCRELLLISSSDSISEANAPSRAKKIIEHGDVIFATTRPTLRRVAIVPSDYDSQICSTGFTVLRPVIEKLNTSYLFYYIQTDFFMDRMEELQRGASYPAVSDSDVKGSEIPIPPLAEQEAIVQVLDKAFTAIDQAKANLEQNITNAQQLFQSKLNQIFSQQGEGWVEKTLAEIATFKYGITLKSSTEGDLRYVRITDINHNGKLTKDGKKYVLKSEDTKEYLISKHDLLMARTGATFAKTLLYNGEEPSVYASYLIKINFTKDIENELYWYFTKTESYWSQANSLATGAAQPHFNGGALKQVVFRYPESKTLQKNVISVAHELERYQHKLIITYQTKLTSLTELKKSLLQQAFAGELT